MSSNQTDPNAGPQLTSEPSGIKLNAGDRLYIPAGALQLWVEDDGTSGTGVSVAVDPWLPDPATSGGTPPAVVDEIIRQAFPVSCLCTNETIHACQKSHDVRTLVVHPDIVRLRHIAVTDGTRACGILDLDKARGKVDHRDPSQRLLVGDVYEPLRRDHCLRGDSPLLEYLLAADERPFRLVQLTGDKLATVDVEDLQKLPVRILLFAKFAQLETLLARHLSIQNPSLLDIQRTATGPASSSLGSAGSGPERQIERYRFRDLLREAKRAGFIEMDNEQIDFLGRYRNNVAHGPRWYITRRSDVGALVNCIKKLCDLIDELSSESD